MLPTQFGIAATLRSPSFVLVARWTDHQLLRPL
jgi:hypothetical protein